MEEMVYKIHWLAFTIHAPNEEAFALYDLLFRQHFGEMEPLGHGGRGFREIYHSLLEFKIYLTPILDNGDYFHFEIPGQACDVLPPDYFPALGEYLECNFPDKYSFTRLDFAFDHVPFTPQQAENAIRENQLRSLAKRASLEIHVSPFAKRDDGIEGTYTVEFGSRTSERMIRVYNKRGFTRLEFQIKDKRAQLITRTIFKRPNKEEWFYIMLAHLLDYIEFKTDWWDTFIDGTARAGATVTTAKELTTEKMVNWVDKQVGPALSVMQDIFPPELLESIIKRGRTRRGARYSLLLGKCDE
jgi:DNA relaxase NicK